MSVDRAKTKFGAKWPDEKVAKRGFAAVPKCLITCMAEIGLKPQELAVLLIIVEKCWEAGVKGWPGVDYISKAIGRKPSATRAITKSLADKGFITKEQLYYNKPNLYGLEPTLQKLAEHMLVCKIFAKNLARDSQKTSSQDSQISSDYIESDLFRNNYLESNITSPHFKSGDPISSSMNYKRATCPKSVGNHKWDEYETETINDNGSNVIYYYKSCVYCGMTFHKKGEPPFGEISSLNYAPSSEPTELPDEPVNLDEIDWPTNGGQLRLH